MRYVPAMFATEPRASPAPAAVKADGAGAASPRPARRRAPHRLTIAVLLVGLVVTVTLTVISRLNYVHNEQREVSTQAQLAGVALAGAAIDVQRQLGRPTTSVAASGDLRLFDAGIKAVSSDYFVSVRLFRMVDGTPRLVRSLREPTVLDTSSAAASALLEKAADTGKLTVTRLATTTSQRLGYAFAATALGRTYVGYAEQPLPGDRHQDIDSRSPLADMDFALYYGTKQNSATLVETNAEDRLPITGTVGRTTIPLGDQVLTAVITPRTPLLGTFAALVAWVIAGVGLLLSLVMALLTERLLRRRVVAEQLAEVSDRLYRAERSVAETLQTALLPDRLPDLPGLAIATRYLAGTEGINVGGDWYDVIDLPDNRIFFTIGDVSGRGLSAATTMSRLRHSITAYAVEGSDPATVLTKVTRLLDVVRDGHFATALCGILDIDAGVLTVANAGHLPLLVIEGGRVEHVAGPLGPPLGVGTDYDSVKLTLSSGSVLLAYTDGLVERRDELIDDSIARLRAAAGPAVGDGDLEAMLDTVLAELLGGRPSPDDTAVMALRWTALS